MITIVFSNQKGGVAKTTSALNVAAYMARAGKRVLAVDLDPQGNLTYSMGYGPEMEIDQLELVDVFSGGADLEEVIRSFRGLDFLPIGLRGTAADMTYTGVGREFMLRDELEHISENYDYCIIDTAPSLNILTVNALTAADYVVIPLTVDAYALTGIAQLSGFIQNVKKYTNKKLRIMGLVRTLYNPRLQTTSVLNNVIEQSLSALRCPLLADIRQSADIGKAQIERTDIFNYSEKSRAAEDYAALAKKIMEKAEGGAR